MGNKLVKAGLIVEEGVNALVTGGLVNVYTGTFGDLTAYPSTNVSFVVEFNITNTAAATLNLNAIAAKDIYRYDDTAVQADDLIAGIPYRVTYSATNDRFYASVVGDVYNIEKYTATFTSQTTVTVTAATHGLGAGGGKVVQVFDGSGNVIDCEITVNQTTGDVTLNFSSSTSGSYTIVA